MWALGQTEDREKAARLFETPIEIRHKCNDEKPFPREQALESKGCPGHDRSVGFPLAGTCG